MNTAEPVAARQRELLLRLLREKTTRFPTSSAQRRLWVAHQTAPHSPRYGMPIALGLRGALDVAALQAALTALVRRQEALRTTFELTDDGPVQVVHPLPDVPLREHDGRPTIDDLRAELARPFDLGRGPLIRATLWRGGPSEHVLLMTLHHIVADAWSLDILLRDLAAGYREAVGMETESLPALTVQAGDYAVWESAELATDGIAGDVDHWRRLLADRPAALDLPRLGPEQASPPAGFRRDDLDPDIVSALRAFTRDRDVTLFMVLHAAFVALLSRFTGQRDVVIGTPVSGRVRRETAQLVGYFVNLLPLRTRWTGDVTFADLVAEVRTNTVAALAHQRVPFERLVADIRGLEPHFDAVLTVQPRAELDRALPGIEVTEIHVPAVAAKFPLSLLVEEVGERLRVHWEYAEGLYPRHLIDSLADGLFAFLRGALARPDAPIGDIALPTGAEQTTRRVRATEATILHRFAEQVAKDPSRIAIDGALTYGQLDDRAGRMATALRTLGARAYQPVGVCLPRGADFVTACLAVLRIGGHYLPLDPEHPADRIAFMCADAGVAHVVTSAAARRPLPSTVAVLDVGETAWTTLEPAAPVEHLPADALALLVFTSGSTGRPKAVGITHRGVVDLVLPGDYGGLGPDCALLWNNSISFDAATWEIWGTLLNGGRVVVLPAHSFTPEALGKAIAGSGATTALLTTALFNAVVDEDVRALSGLRTLLVGGEALSADHVRRATAALPQTEIRNAYGPAEITTIATTYRIPAAFEAGAVPIGHPLNGTRAALMDADGRPTPAGARGEIWLSGDGLAHGYLGRPALTAEQFVPGSDGRRWYRTRDLAVRTPEGLVFHGRSDNQVKIRGHRVEPDEVATVLLGHPSVGQAVVTAHRRGPNDQRLVAYLVLHEPADPQEIRRWAREILPEYLVPALVIPVAAIPLTVHGKVDAAALPEPQWSVTGATHVPLTGTQAHVADLWASILDIDPGPIGPDTNFFDIGGHSLTAARVVSRLRSTRQVDVSLEEFFAGRTVAALASMIDGAAPPAGDAPPVVAPRDPTGPRPGPRPAPLSFAQMRLYFLSLLGPESSAYHVPLTMRLEGDLDVPALAAALRWLVQRHEALRTTVVGADGHYVQAVHSAAAATPDLVLVDVAGDEAAAQRIVTEAAARPIPLTGTAAPLRTTLVRVGPAIHLLSFVVHHFAADGWSVGVLGEDLSAAYAALRAGREPAARPLPVQYSDAATWQRTQLTDAYLKPGLDYWRTALAGAPHVLDLPTDRPRSAEPTWSGVTADLALTPELTATVRTLARRQQCTEFMVLFAAWATVLARFSRQDDLLIGTPAAGRDHPDLERLVGLFVNTLVLRADLTGDPTVRELLARVRATCIRAYEHQEVPFERLVEELAPARDLTRGPLVQVMMALNNTADVAGPASVRLPGLESTAVPVDAGGAQFELSLFFAEGPEALSVSCQYRRELFEPGTITALLEALRETLAGFAAHPDAPVSAAVPLGTDLVAPSAEGPDLRQASVLNLIHRQVAENPDRTAVLDGAGTALTYAQLWQHAGAVATDLVAAGVRPGQVIGVCVERRPAMVGALLGVWLAGAAYLPLDEQLPEARMRLMVDRSATPLILVDDALRSRLPGGVPTVAHRDGGTTVRPIPDLHPESAAYVLFTSGSTGEPKGVMIPHGAVTNFIHAMIEDLPGLSRDDRMAAITSLSFDIALLEMFGPIAAGGRLHVAGSGTVRDGRALARFIAETDVNLLQATPATWQMLREAGWTPPAALRGFTGGEAMSEHLAADLLATGIRLWNNYGPTETTVYSAIGEVLDADRISLGAPVAGTRLRIVDRHDVQVPDTFLGELWIGGAGVGHGYLGRPALTADRFRPASGGERWYRTGDLVRLLPGGRLAYLGRVDTQAKIRGHRVEPGEVETAMLDVPGVTAAAVVVVRDSLAGYFVTGAPEVSGDAIRAHLRTVLPPYMVPDHFVAADRLPLTPNGKLDRRALAQRPIAPAARRPMTTADPQEATVAAAWREVLMTPPTTADDDFFALGGHSLHAARVAQRLSAATGSEVPVRLVFEQPTVAGQAAWLRSQSRTRPEPVGVTTAGPGPYPLSFAQQRLWFLAQLEPDSAAYNMPLVVRLTGRLDVPALAAAFHDITERHEALRTTFSDGPVQNIAAAGTSMIHCDVRGCPERAGAVLEQTAFHPFDLASDCPPVRLVVISVAADDHLLVLVMHHVIADGWSISVLARDLGEAYRRRSGAAASAGLPPAPPLRLVDHAVRQRARLDDETLDRAVTHWRGRLAGAPRVLDLPASHARPPRRGHAGRTIPIQVPADVAAAVRALAHDVKGTEFMVLLAAFAVVLSRLAGQDDLLIGAPLAGREHDNEDVVGLFADTVVLRADLTGDPTVTQLLGRLRDVCLDAYQRTELPFEKLVEALSPERDPSRSPLFQVMIALNNIAPVDVELPGLHVEAIHPDNPTAKFDIVLNLVDRPDGGIGGGCEFDTGIYDESMVCRLVAQFVRTLRDLTSGGDRRLSGLPTLDELESAELLAQFNDVPASYDPRPVLLHRLVEAQVDRTPLAVAVSQAPRPGRPLDGPWPALTYAELDARANRLARTLLLFGVRTDDVVGICGRPGIDLVVGQLAILKAGASFLPLDPGHPPARLAMALSDTGARAVLADPTGAAGLADATVPVIPLESAPHAHQPSDRPRVRSVPAHHAYVIYTSGSTGVPKGVPIEHRAIANNLLWMQQDWPLGPADRLLHKTATTFDVAVKEVFWPLLCGAELVVAAPEGRRDPEHLVELISAAGITVTHFVPSMLELVLAAAERTAGFGTGLRYVMCGAETLPVGLQDRFFDMTDAALLHMYGPTETAIAVTGFTCVRADHRDRVPLGRPMPWSRLYVLDQAGNPVPTGVWGELYVGGVPVGRGYLNRPAETADAYRPDPYSGDPGARLYRTHDIVRHGEDGLLEFQGRRDNQVKVRGFRVELGEVEAALRALPGVAQAVVILDAGDTPSDARLLAYVVVAKPPLDPHPLDPDALRDALSERLPQYMVPAVVVRLDAMPLNDNAKVDRAALPRPPRRRSGTHEYVAPRDDIERAIAEAWSETLGVDEIGAFDDFFALGGHSLQIARVAAQLRQRFAVELRLADLFAEPTVAAVAQLIRAAPPATPIRRRSRTAYRAAPGGPADHQELEEKR